MADADRFTCVEDGCGRGCYTGHALYRVSPKGELFQGKCEEHYQGPVDPIAQAIERRNLDGGGR
jgi:hypothetical protein